MIVEHPDRGEVERGYLDGRGLEIAYACSKVDVFFAHVQGAARLVYPDAYRQRSIEGWARLTYDVAPWGAIDNVRVVESQPSTDFGRQAQIMLRQAKVTPQGSGATGCNQTVRFQMAHGTAADEMPSMD